jgi:hypothetical protein
LSSLFVFVKVKTYTPFLACGLLEEETMDFYIAGVVVVVVETHTHTLACLCIICFLSLHQLNHSESASLSFFSFSIY